MRMTKKINYKKELNAEQFKAATSIEGPHLVIAGAGSGKTRVLVYRTAYLVEQGVLPEEILLLTFTRRASREMLERASSLLDDRCRNVAGGTFHSFANAILRRYSSALGLPRYFTILDQNDAENAVHRARTQLQCNKLDKRFPRKHTLLAIISKSVNKCADVGDVVVEEYPHFFEWTGVIQAVKEEYVRYKKNFALLDYDDLLVDLRTLLQTHPDICEQLSERYRYLMIDEYQDTNRIQAQIAGLLTCRHNNIMAVGDDAQSIYSFRGANFKNIIDFPKTFAGTRIITLEENYRSTQPILDLTNEVISGAGEKYEKNLFTRNHGDRLPVYVDVYDENSQSRYILNTILKLRSQGVPSGEIAVLFRSGWHSNDLEVELAGNGIPFAKYGGQKFIEAAHIKDVLSGLSLVHNPGSQLSWQRILTLLPGIGERTAENIFREIAERNIDGVNEAILAKRPELRQLFELLKQMDPLTQKPQELLRSFLDFYVPLMARQYDDHDKRVNDLESLDKISSRYGSLEQFLADMALDPPEKNLVDQGIEAADAGRVVLSTIHSAKGLEWHTVFVIFVAEGYLPSYQSLSNGDALEEERRLFYVATTRARTNLFLLRPEVDRSPRSGWDTSGPGYTRVSRFLEEGEILDRFVAIETDHAYHPRTRTPPHRSSPHLWGTPPGGDAGLDNAKEWAE